MPYSDKDVRSAIDDQILNKLMEGFQLISFDWRYLYLNDAVCRHGKYQRQDLIGYTMMEKYPGIEQTELFQTLEKCMHLRVSDKLENKFSYPDGTEGWFELSIEPVSEGLFILSVDITERKEAEESLRKLRKNLEIKVKERTSELEKANQEITTLYREMHHRIKNNLQIVASLLSMQARNADTEYAAEQLEKSRDRIQTIAQVHENLYKKERLSDLDIKTYISELVKKQISSQKQEDCTIDFSLNCETIVKSIDFLVPLGLLINELITNSIKHGFKNRSTGFISIDISKKGNVINLTYEDNGVGISEADLTPNDTLGTILIDGLTEQLNGSYTLESTKNGVKYMVHLEGSDTAK